MPARSGMSVRDRVSDGYVLGIDGGTEGVRAGVFDLSGNPVASALEPYGLHTPRPGWAEQDPAEWWRATVATIRQVLAEHFHRLMPVRGFGDYRHIVLHVDDRGHPDPRHQVVFGH